MSRGKRMVELCKLNANTLHPGTMYDCTVDETPLLDISPVIIGTSVQEGKIKIG